MPPNDQGHRAGAGDVLFQNQLVRPLQCTAWFALIFGSHRGTEKDSQLAIDDSRDAIHYQGFAEIQQVPKFHSGQAEVGENLLLVSWMNVFNGLECHKHLPFDDQLRSKALIEPLPLVFNRNGNLTLNRQSPLS